eukprot:2719107-Ditylum_brightwellii.AAC.1
MESMSVTIMDVKSSLMIHSPISQTTTKVSNTLMPYWRSPIDIISPGNCANVTSFPNELNLLETMLPWKATALPNLNHHSSKHGLDHKECQTLPVLLDSQSFTAIIYHTLKLESPDFANSCCFHMNICSQQKSLAPMKRKNILISSQHFSLAQSFNGLTSTSAPTCKQISQKLQWQHASFNQDTTLNPLLQ